MRQRKDHLDALAISLIVVCCLFWGFQQVLIKATIPAVPPLWQAGVRFAGATVVLWAWCLWRHIPLFACDGTLGPGLLSGLLFGVELACMYVGLRDTTASRLTVFVYTAPFVVALLLPRFVPAERLHRTQWLGLLLAFGAVGLAFAEGFTGQVAGPNQLRGDALALIAGVGWGLTTLVIRTTRLGAASAEKILFYQVSMAALVALPLSLLLGESWTLSYPAWAWSSIALQTLVGAFASYLAWMWLLRLYPDTRLSAFTFLTPVFALVMGVALLDEPLTVQLVIALLGVSLGILLVSRQPARP